MTDTGPRRFVKSSFSTGQSGNCVEWAFTPAGVTVRDSKDRSGPELLFTLREWTELTAAAATGAPHQSISPGSTGVHLTGQGGQLTFTPAEWHAFTAAARTGECRPTPAATH
uniref:DUF397 domain-containing protein n=1 Tax=Pseudonocardia sp. CA-138482 TaxID=3240023 RepID=UPI003F49820F